MKSITFFCPENEINPVLIDNADIAYTSEIVEIEAIVSAEEQIISEKKELMVHIISLFAWKFSNQSKIHKKGLDLLRTIKPTHSKKENSIVLRGVDQNHPIENEIPPYSIIKFKARINESSNRAIFLEGHIQEETNQYPKLLAIVQKLTAPVEIDIKWLGQLTLNKKHNWFEGISQWNNQKINLSIDVDTKRKALNMAKKLEVIWANSTEWEEKTKDYAVSQLLELKNDTWLEEGEAKLSITSFKEKMILESIHIYPRDTIEFWFNDSDLFWGHSIQISGNFKGTFSQADIPG